MALGILSVVLIALGGLMFQVSLYTRRSAALAYRSAAIQAAEAWMWGLPWDSIPAAVGCITDTSGQLIYSRCLSVQDLAARHRRLTTVVSAMGNLTVPAETLVIDRVRALSPSPFLP